MFLIYTSQITNRLRYVSKLIFEQLMGIEHALTISREDFENFNGPKLNYSFEQFNNEPFIAATELLFQSGIRDLEINVFNWNEVSVFFSTSKRSILPFDIFAASFYLVSRYEEYLPCIKDNYSRYEASSSLARTNNFLKKPVINIWVEEFKTILYNIYPTIKFRQNHYKYIPTIDIDNAWAFKEKGFIRTTGSLIKSLLRFDIENTVFRIKTLLGLKDDPYDTYQLLAEIHKKNNIKAIFFFLVGDYGTNDTNVSITNHKMKTLIKSTADYAEVGIHPSFASNSQPEKFEMEINRLEKILNRDVTKSRQHFLKLVMPNTYRKLIELDIENDYTMGYATEIGFRAGICTPFYFYDLDSENETKLKLHPFAVMDATLNLYLKLSPEEALTQTKSIIDEIRSVNGTFISLWHNETLSDWQMWKGWREIYPAVVNYASKTD